MTGALILVGQIRSLVTQYRLVIPATIEDAQYRNLVPIYGKGNHGALAIVGDAQARPDIATVLPSIGRRGEALAVGQDSAGIISRDLGRCGLGDIPVEFEKMLPSLWRDNDRVGVQESDKALACSAASAVRTSSGVWPLCGFALRAS